MHKKTRTLFIIPGPVPPTANTKRNRFSYLSEFLSGDVLQSVWEDLDEQGKQRTNYEVGSFVYHAIKSTHISTIRKVFKDISFFVRKGRELYKQEPYQAIVCYGMTRTGIAGALLKVITGAKLVIEVPGRPIDAFLTDTEHPGFADKLKNKLTGLWCQVLFRYADCLRLFYPGQLEGFSFAKSKLQKSFPDFVPLADISHKNKEHPYVLFLGFPWFLKGVDILIQAYKKVMNDFPEFELKIVGHCPDKTRFETLLGDCQQVKLLDAVPHEGAISLMESCACFVLPSRTEGMPRVLVEAMAASKPFIASKVGGIPHYLTHEKEGLLFDSEDIESLANCLRRILADENLRKELGANGYKLVSEGMSEKYYQYNFKELIESVVR